MGAFFGLVLGIGCVYEGKKRGISNKEVGHSLGQYFQISIPNFESHKTTYSLTRKESKGLQWNFPEPLHFSQD